ncbi:hypothetical protein [Amphibacillus sediminis]|uniref:hypothetical protein n=1 Tax=Amphibacillus sediminis TaxID=360185 RepID=UPI0008328C03|nr:hypothetical protein [Amphibacillus sediminis]
MKEVQVYLRNEDEAENLRSKLNKYDTENIMLDHIEHNSMDHLVVPYIQTGSTASDAPQTMAGPISLAAYQEIIGEEDDREQRRTVLSFKVSEHDFNHVLTEIHNADGYVDRAVFE